MHLIQIGATNVTIATGPPVKPFKIIAILLEHCSKGSERAWGTAPTFYVVQFKGPVRCLPIPIGRSVDPQINLKERSRENFGHLLKSTWSTSRAGLRLAI